MPSAMARRLPLRVDPALLHGLGRRPPKPALKCRPPGTGERTQS